MNLYSYNVPTTFVDNSSGIIDHNTRIQLWWRERCDWLKENGKGRWHAYRVPVAYTCIIDCEIPSSGNNNVDHFVLWTFSDKDTATVFKLAWS